MAVVRDGTPNLWVGTMQDIRPQGDLVQRTFEREGGINLAWSPDSHPLANQCTRGTDTGRVCDRSGWHRAPSADESARAELGGRLGGRQRSHPVRRPPRCRLERGDRLAIDQGRADIDALYRAAHLRSLSALGCLAEPRPLRTLGNHQPHLVGRFIAVTTHHELTGRMRAAVEQSLAIVRRRPWIETRARSCATQSLDCCLRSRHLIIRCPAASATAASRRDDRCADHG